MSRLIENLQSADLLACLREIGHGIEKEGLRVDAQGQISHRPHPPALGSALCNPYMTTDYSEALLEFVTPVYRQPEDALSMLSDLHTFAYRQLVDELIWPGSMPCAFDSDQDIPIAVYGSSNIGQLKHVYRVGLGNRYGRMMQAIAGIHYNFSLPDRFWPLYAGWKGWGEKEPLQQLRSRGYFCLIANFNRHAWLLLYLFGASPALDRTFAAHSPHPLPSLSPHTSYLPEATSLRMGDLGYQNNAQANLNVSFDSLDAYTHSLSQALVTPHPPYQRIGIKVEGQYRQLNSNILQIENEFYGTIRPKCPARSGEKPLHALRQRGVAYVEVRNLDVNPLLPLGIDSEEACFLDAFLLACLFHSCTPVSPVEYGQIHFNQQQICNFGRQPQLQLFEHGQSVTREKLSEDILASVEQTATLLDLAHDSSKYHRSWQKQRAKVHDPSLTPSAQLLAAMQQQALDYQQMMLQLAQKHRQQQRTFSAPQREEELTHAAGLSRQQQATVEQQDNLDFDSFLAHYLANSLLPQQ